MEIDLLKPSLFSTNGSDKCNCSPCYNCLFRKILAAGFDRNVWGKDCPRFGERGVCVLSENDIHGDTDGIPYHVNG